jgi:hypothetical protein
MRVITILGIISADKQTMSVPKFKNISVRKEISTGT